MFILIIPQKQRVVFFAALKSVGRDWCRSAFVTSATRCGHLVESGRWPASGLLGLCMGLLGL